MPTMNVNTLWKAQVNGIFILVKVSLKEDIDLSNGKDESNR